MFHGFPQVQVVSDDAPTGESIFAKDSDSHVELPPAKKVRISFPALTHLGSFSQDATCHSAVGGRLCGVQQGDTILITSVLPSLGASGDAEDERDDTTESKQQQKMYEKVKEMLRKECLDSYSVGYFIVSSACVNDPYSVVTADRLANLAIDGHPSVLLVYDPFRTGLMGKLYLRAFVPTDAFLDFSRKNKKTKKTDKKSGMQEEARLLRACSVPKQGVLREVKVEVEVDAYQLFCLNGIDIAPLPSNSTVHHSDSMADYKVALLESVQRNLSDLEGKLSRETSRNQRDENNVPPARGVDTMLALVQLREQAQHLEALCDGTLLISSLLRDL